MPAVSTLSALNVLTKARLLELASRFGIEIAAARRKSQVVDTLVRTRRTSLDQILATMKLEELKGICRAHGLEGTAREKQILIDRILGVEGSVRSGEEPGSRVAPEPPELAPKRGGRRSKTDDEGESDTTPSAWALSTKVRLQRFALGAAGGYRDRDADLRFAGDLIRCFGWGPDDILPAEIPATVRVVQQGKGSDQMVSALLRERRAVVQVIDRERTVREVWTELLPLLLQLAPVPQYVVLTNQRDVELYDLARSRTEPRLHIALDQLPKYCEAFPFLAQDWSPGATPLIINVERVSKGVADLVARVYRSFKAEHPRRVGDVIRFTLQCIIAMFAEDIGLLPREYFTSLLYQAAEKGDASERVAELFRQMSTPGDGTREIRYFNGGLFKNPVTLSINPAQLAALTKAAEADWTYVDPHIFGAVFQGIMDDDERHATGAHYTAKEDIMRVVGPTIVEPWRKRIAAAKTLTELKTLRKELTQFRVLDPACGSGNFLYVAFRELYRLETEVLARMQEFPSVGEDASNRGAWGSGIPTTNFYGIDINDFAVELARATLNIAKKIAFDERHQVATERFGQVQMELDPSLPLDNLEQNIISKDALFIDWEQVEAIVGNPPILGDRKIRAELGEAYIGRLKDMSGVDGVVDLSCYWFRRAHDRLRPGGRAGMVGTSGLRVGKAREASLDYIVNRGGTITSAVSSMLWPGDAAVDVCMVNWIKGEADGLGHLIVDGKTYRRQRIPTHLQLHADTSGAKKLEINKHGTAMGVIFGSDAFTSDGDDFPLDQLGKPYIRPVAAGTAMLTGALERAPTYCIYLVDFASEREAAAASGPAFRHLQKHVYPIVKGRSETGGETHHYERWLKTWWQPREPSSRFFRALEHRLRFIACSNPQARPIFSFLSTVFVPTNTMQVFAYDDDYSFGIIQSNCHWEWLKAKGGKVRADFRYVANVWKTFPWPQQPPEEIVLQVCEAARALRVTRRELMGANGWSLRALYQAADVLGPHPLKEAQARLDDAVSAAYDLPNGQDPLEFLLELNLALAEDEEEAHPICGPGLPLGFDPTDRRWTSDDCIEPPSLVTDKKENYRG